MNVLQKRALTLLAAIAVAGAGCKGDTGPAGTPGQGSNTTVNLPLTTSGLVVAVKGVTVNADQTVTVNFTAKDDQGNPVDLAGKYSTNAPMAPRFSLSQVTAAADGTMLPYTVLTKTGTSTTSTDPTTVTTLNPTALTPATPAVATTGTLTENGSGAGDYTYVFPACSGVCSATAPGTGSNTGKTVLTVSNSVKVDPKSSNTYVVWIEAARQTNTTNTDDAQGFKAVNVEYDFVPNGGTAAPKRQIAATADCTKCHNGFKPEGSVKTAFHGGTRVEAAYCNVCHNPARKSTPTTSDGTTPAATSGIFVHRIHAGKELQAANVFHGINEVTYPQDLRNCDACHKDAAQGAQAKTTASRAVCGSCHDYVVFDPAKVAGLPACVDQAGNEAKDANGNWLQCAHAAGANTDDTSCKGCHVAGGAGFIGDFHVAVVPPDSGSTYNFPVTTGTSTTGADFLGNACTTAAPCTCTVAAPCFNTGNNNTNAAYLPAAGAVPAGSTQVTYVVKSVSAFKDTSVTPNVLRPQIVFKFQQSTNGAAPADVVFNTFGSGKTELMDNFVGSPSVYFAYAVPQDGITAPADFNASQSGYIKAIWNGAALGSSSGTMIGPDSSGFYTITLGVGPNSVDTTTASLTTGTQAGVACTKAVPCVCTVAAPCQVGAVIPASAVMLTGGVGYTYGLQTTQPLTQTNLAAYPYSAATKIGGLINPAPDQWMVGAGYKGRRVIVDNAKCKNCHVQLGAAPTFHAGQRNDGPTCSFCHTANQNNSGWAGNSKDFIHALHAGLAADTKLPNGALVTGGSGIRTVPFGWHAVSATEGYWEITFPGQHNYCDACHATPADGTHTYDFSAAASAAALPNLLASTAATGTTAAPTFSSSPYIAQTAGTAYGSGFSIDKANGTIANAAATTLVVSPITAACVACHDSPAAKGHMVGNGGLFYSPRSTLTQQVATSVGESCLLCHGAGKVAAIADVHR